MASNGPAGLAWLSIAADPAVPHGVIMMQSGWDRLAKVVSSGGGMGSEEMREDLRSFRESFPFIVRPRDGSEAIRCECCGTLVALVPETSQVRDGAATEWKPAIWEPASGRKHTLRRCEWWRASSAPLSEIQPPPTDRR